MAYTFVQVIHNEAYAALSTTITASITVTAGNLLAVAAGHAYSEARTTTITDDKGNTWSVAVEKTESGNGTRTGIYYCVVAAGKDGAIVVTATFSGDTGANQRFIAVHEYSGNASTTPADHVPVGVTGYGSSIVTSSCVPTQANDLVFAFGFNDSDATYPLTKANANFTERLGSIGGSGEYYSTADWIQTTATTTTCTWTMTENRTWTALIASFKVAAAPAAATPPRIMRLFAGFKIRFIGGVLRIK